MSDDTALLDRFLRLRGALLQDCQESNLPLFIAASVLQSLALELQAEAIGRDLRSGSPPSG